MISAQDSRTFYKSIMQYFHANDVKYAKKSKQKSIFTVKINEEENENKKLWNLKEIEDHVNSGSYDNNRQWLFIQHVTLALHTIQDKHNKKSFLHKKAIELLEYFEVTSDKWMKDHGFCCGIYNIMVSKEIECSHTKTCIIKDGERMFRYEDFAFCERHFKKLCDKASYIEKDNSMVLEIEINVDLKVPISKFKIFTFRQEVHEAFILCKICERIFHERCELFLETSFAHFICKNCRDPLDFRFAKLHAKDLPITDFDAFITKFLMSNIGNEIDFNLSIRLVSSMNKSFLVKRHIDVYRNHPREINYTNGTLFAFFEDSDGYDLCFFAIYFQLYDDKAPKPNQNTAYLSYIDSVKFLPSNIRTKIYQFIILGVFEYLKQHGYEKIFIWSCPPTPNNDYIFPSKPPDQKTPNVRHLSEWYRDMIDQGKMLQIISHSEGSESFAFHSDWHIIDNIPLMDGDLWNVRLEEAILSAEMESVKTEAATTRSGIAHYDDTRSRIWEHFQVQTKGFDENYFVLHINMQKSEGNRDNLRILGNIDRDWINNRHTLVDMLTDLKLVFSNKRQARFATYVLLHRISLESMKCRICNEYVGPLSLDPFLLCQQCSFVAANPPKLQLKKIKMIGA